jgi:hypothetical protein
LLPIGRGNNFDTVREIEYRPNVKILGQTFWSTIQKSTIDTWSRLTGQARALAREAYSRELNFANRTHYVHSYLLAKIWFAAQIFVVPSQNVQQLNIAITYFIWRGSVFRVPINVLRKPKTEGGWDLIDIFAKCTALLLCRLFIQSQMNGITTAKWLKFWCLTAPQPNPPNEALYLRVMTYIREYAKDMAHIPTNIIGQRFSNFFQVGTTFISPNVLRTTLLLNVLSIC